MPKRAESESNAASTPLVSVFVGVYNHAPYVRECLDSILHTKYPNLEVFVVNDASPDNSDEVIRGWMADHPDFTLTYLHHERNLGLTKSLNEVIDLAKGAFFCPIASDDVMLTNGVADRVNYLLQHPAKLAVFADCHVIDDSGRLVQHSALEDGMCKAELEVEALIPYNVVFNWSVPGPVFLCRMDAFKIVGRYDEGLTVEDWDMFLRLAATGRLGYYGGFVAKYRIHSKNMSRTPEGSIRREFSAVLNEDTLKTIEKNIGNFRGINALRLRAYRSNFYYEGSQTLLWRRLRFVQKTLLMATSNRAYLLLRALLKLSRSPHVGRFVRAKGVRQ